MLKNTGYFRGIECPFSDGCLRPHCLFKHDVRCGGNVGSGKAGSGAENEPHSPELPVPPCMDEVISGVFSERSQHILELERVNKAIEEVKSQVEREQKKYEELLETQNGPLKKCLQSDTLSLFEYDPGCSGSRASFYNPTPLVQSVKPCKYTLDNVEHNRHKSQVLEYIPTTVAQVPSCRTHKYVIDNSKPYKDMEYDPMLNYSARLFNKVKPEKVTKRSRTYSQSDGPLFKKLHNQASKIMVEAKFSTTKEDSQLQCLPKIGKPLSSDSSSSLTTLKSLIHVTDTAVQYDIDARNSLKPYSREAFKKIDKPVDPKYEKTECIKEQASIIDSGQMTYTNKELKKASSKHLKKNIEQVDFQNMHKLEEYKQKKHEKPSKHTDNEKTTLCFFPKAPIYRQNKKDNENEYRKEKSSKNDSMAKDGDIKNGKHDANIKSLPLEKFKVAAQETFNIKTNLRTLCHVDLFGDDTSDEEENRKTSQQSNLTSNKCEKSAHKMKVITSRTSISSVDSPEMDLDSDTDLDPMEECLRVFNESHEIKTEDKGRMGKQMSDNEEKSQQSLVTSVPGQKKRISHVTSENNMDSSSKAAIHPYCLPTPQEICYKRIQRAQEQAAQLLCEQKSSLLFSFAQKSNSLKRISKMSGPLSSVFCEKNAQSLGTVETCNVSSSAIKVQTQSGMASKTKSTTTQQRRAHVPSLQSAALKRPILPTEFGAKVPTTVRQRYLNLFVDECLTFCQSQQEAFNKALEEEKMVYSRSSSRNIYLNVAVNTLKKLRSQDSEKKVTYPKVNKKAVSHESVLGGKLAAKTSFSVKHSIHRDEELTEATIYKKLKKYMLTSEQMKEHGYPLADPDKPGRAVVFSGEKSKNSDSSCKICCRCGAEYLVTPSGNCLRQEECVYHWGRLRRQRVPGGLETHYNCCCGAVGSNGCQVAQQHVQDGRKDNLDGFVKTFEKLNIPEENHGVFALDCEMCYTTKGLELTRVTVINSQLKVVYDTFIKPDNKIMDYNTRFSGVTEEDLQNTSITLRDVQAVLLCMVSCDSILIGHSLESDLFALKLIHPTVVDTAVVFPHRLGLPYKRALRSLMAEYLKRIIQDSVEGHDSSEDACSCMELMIWRLKEDAKVKR